MKSKEQFLPALAGYLAYSSGYGIPVAALVTYLVGSKTGAVESWGFAAATVGGDQPSAKGVTVYYRDSCGHCRDFKQKMAAKNVNCFKMVDTEQSGDPEVQKKAVPDIYVDGRPYNGSRDDLVEKYANC